MLICPDINTTQHVYVIKTVSLFRRALIQKTRGEQLKSVLYLILKKCKLLKFCSGRFSRKSHKKISKVSQAAVCDGNNYTTSAGEQNPTPSTLPIY